MGAAGNPDRVLSPPWLRTDMQNMVPPATIVRTLLGENMDASVGECATDSVFPMIHAFL